MKSLRQFITETTTTKLDIIKDFVKIEMVYGKKMPGYQKEVEMNQRRADSLGVSLDDVRKEVKATWKPGNCPKCGGLGFFVGDHANENDYFCNGTGLHGMSKAQAKWYTDMFNALEKMKNDRKVTEHPEQIPSHPIAKQIVAAGEKTRVRHADFPRDADASAHELYQGHEYEFYINHLRTILFQIAYTTAVRAKWRESSYA